MLEYARNRVFVPFEFVPRHLIDDAPITRIRVAKQPKPLHQFCTAKVAQR